ncbi:cytochrome P450 [Sporormia fimetaria CBS 119925]|uniref:Cytochrome P450 n=1 Tax=Sporormia fimetaria CBS 119925 TaxID=1340428 RepID=A0A6A6VJ22_9PLEO|nr:cytochrome P450 [Sporormia fimetaria CBS 119925]
MVLLLQWLYTKLRNNKNLPDLAPGSLPLLGHGLMFLRQPTKIAAILSDPRVPKVLRFTTPVGDIYVPTGSSEIVSVFMNPKTYDFVAMKTLVQRDVFGVPKPVLRLIQEDDSGFSVKPLAGSKVSPHRRYNYMEHRANDELVKPPAIAAVMQHFEESLTKNLETCEVPKSGEWATIPNLYLFVRGIVTKAVTDSFFGPNLLLSQPQLEQEFWEHDSNIGFFANRIPRWLSPKPYRVRDRCYRAFEQWRAKAFQKAEKEGGEIPLWSRHAGFKINTVRNSVFQRFEEWTEWARASSDFSLMFGVNSNTVKVSFWYFAETWRNKELFPEALEEVNKSMTVDRSGNRRFDVEKLISSPLLESIFMETLRMYVALFVMRETTRDAELGNKLVPAGSTVLVSSWSQHMNEGNWNPDNDPNIPPATEFWGKRFLEYPEDGSAPRFRMDYLSGGKWTAFSMGEHLCPGRHIAKRQVLLTFAHLATRFDVEAVGDGDVCLERDMKYFGYGTMPPKTAISCRIRRRNV